MASFLKRIFERIIFSKQVVQDAITEDEQVVQDVVTEDEQVVQDVITEDEAERKTNDINKIMLLPSLATFLPELDSISIISYADANQSFGKHYRIGLNHSPEEPFIPYIQYESKAKSDVGFDRHCNTVFARSFHPFIHTFTKDTVFCSENMVREFGFRPFYYEVSENRLQVSFNSGYYYIGYEETPNFIKYSKSYTESYHDGGGSGSTAWTIYAAPGIEAEQELSQCRMVLNRINLPACKGHWFDGEHLYLVEPWGIPGIFEYYFCETEHRDCDSDEEVWTVGVKYSETEKTLSS